MEEFCRSLCWNTKWKWKLEYFSDEVDELQLAKRVDRIARWTMGGCHKASYSTIEGRDL